MPGARHHHLQACSAQPHGGKNPGEQGGEYCRRGRNTQNTLIRRNVERDRHIRKRNEFRERGRAGQCERRSHESATNGENRSLDDELSHQSRAARAERRPRGKFRGSRRPARQQQIGDVHGRDEQNHARYRQHQRKGLAKLAAQRVETLRPGCNNHPELTGLRRRSPGTG